MYASCILLNGDYTFLCIVDWKKAMCLVIADKIKVLKYSDRVIHGIGMVFRAPAVLLLIKVVRRVYRNKVPFAKRISRSVTAIAALTVVKNRNPLRLTT